MPCCAEHQVMSSASSYILDAYAASPYITSLLLGPPLLLLLLFYPALVYLSPKEKKDLPIDAYFYTTAASDTKESIPLPRLIEKQSDEKATVQLSVVIPAYNEEARLQKMLTETVDYLESLRKEGKTITGAKTEYTNGHHLHHHSNRSKEALEKPLKTYEILIIDDGSKDKTVSEARAFAKKHSDLDIRLVRMGRNSGKGAAVRHGVLHTRGQLIIFCDADGATRFKDLSSLAKEMIRIMTKAGHGIVCGSRAHLVGSDAVVKRSFVRNFLMHSFHLVLSLLLRPPNPFAFIPSFAGTPLGTRTMLPSQPPVKDTQCGFKLFTRSSAQLIFPLSHIDRWIFDVELLLLAEMASSRTLSEQGAAEEWSQDTSTKKDPLEYLPLPIAEVAVDWREVEGSKIDLLKDSIGMALDLVVIRLNYALGRWTRPDAIKAEADADACCK